MAEQHKSGDPNGLHFAAGAFIGGVTGLLLNGYGYSQHDAALSGLLLTCVAGALKAVRDAGRMPQPEALKYGLLIASGGLITPLMLWLQ